VIVAFANQKGGVGKTTTTINLGAYLAARGRRVLIIDLDPQGNTTSGLGRRAPDGRTMYEVLLGTVRAEDAIIPGGAPDLWLLPASPALAGADVELVPLPEREFYLRRALDPTPQSPPRRGEGESDRANSSDAGSALRTPHSALGFDYILIDCPPSLGLLTINALTAADEVIVPVQCEYLALEGLGHLARTLELVRRQLNPRLRLRGLLMTMYDARTNLAAQVVEEVRRHFPQTFQTVIPRSVRLSEAPSHGHSILAYAPSSSGARAYSDLATEFLAQEATRV
jgi:chromosome partitioning protein